MSLRNQVRLMVIAGVVMASLVFSSSLQILLAITAVGAVGGLFGDAGEVVDSGYAAGQAIVAAIIAVASFFFLLGKTAWQWFLVEFRGYELVDEDEEYEEVYEDEETEETESSEEQTVDESTDTIEESEPEPVKAVRKRKPTTRKTPKK